MKANENRYEKMNYRKVGKSGLKLPALSLGLWHNFGDIDVLENSKKIICQAFDHGITHFDLANNYGTPLGSAEKNFGRILHEELSAYRDELIISSKAGYWMWPGPYGDGGSRKYLFASINQSLKKLGLDYVDIFYSHRYDPETPLEETMGALSSIVKQGKAIYIGISNYPPQETQKALALLREMGTPCLIHQSRYNMIDRHIEEEGLLETIDQEELGMITFSPLEQGILSDRYLNGIPEDSRAAHAHGYLQKEQITDEIISKIQKLNEIAKKRGQSLAQMAIAWLLQKKQIASVLIGVSRLSQLEDNLKTLENLKISKEELTTIDKILKHN